MIDIRPATPADLPEIDALLDAGFGPARRNRTAYRLRDAAAPIAALSFAARDGETLVGSLQCWPLQVRGISGVTVPLMLLGPMVTALDWRGQGVASRMIYTALAAADAVSASPILLIGDEPFYGRFGFSAVATAAWHMPGPVDRARLLLRGDAAALPVIGSVEARDAARRAA